MQRGNVKETYNDQCVDFCGSDSHENLVNTWFEAERDLHALAQQEDDLLGTSVALMPSFDKRSEQLTVVQAEALRRLVRTPAASIEDVFAKLSIWMAHNFPSDCVETHATEVDQLAAKAISELAILIGRDADS